MLLLALSACKTGGGGVGGHAPQGIFQWSDALRLLLRPFWDRSRATVATCLAIASHFWLFTCVCICYPSDIEFPWRMYYDWQNSGWGDRWSSMQRMSEECHSQIDYHNCTFPCDFSMIQDVHLLRDCWWWHTRTTWELLSTWIGIYLHKFILVDRKD